MQVSDALSRLGCCAWEFPYPSDGEAITWYLMQARDLGLVFLISMPVCYLSVFLVYLEGWSRYF